MRKTTIIASTVALMLALLVSIGFCSSAIWSDQFSTSNFRTTGTISGTSWLITSANANLTKTCNGTLILNLTRATVSAEQKWIAERSINATTKISSVVKWKLPLMPDNKFQIEVGVMADATHWIWKLHLDKDSIKIGVESGSFTWNTILLTPTANEWYTHTIEIGNETVSVKTGSTTESYSSDYSWDDCNLYLAKYIIQPILATGGSSATGEAYIDYISWGSYADPVMAMLPTILSLSMFAVALGLLGKFASR